MIRQFEKNFIGRFWQLVNRLLKAIEVKTVVLDHEAAQIDNMRKINIKSYYGDATLGSIH